MHDQSHQVLGICFASLIAVGCTPSDPSEIAISELEETLSGAQRKLSIAYEASDVLAKPPEIVDVTKIESITAPFVAIVREPNLVGPAAMLRLRYDKKQWTVEAIVQDDGTPTKGDWQRIAILKAAFDQSVSDDQFRRKIEHIRASKTYMVNGKVAYLDGSPVEGATVAFVGTDYTAVGGCGEEGTFALCTFEGGDGAPAGEYQVVIALYDDEGNNLLAPKFADEKTSGLSATVSASDSNSFTFKVEKNPGLR